MITFDPNKTKKMDMTFQMEGVDSDKTSFNFIFEYENIKYSFPINTIGSKLDIMIPPLSEVIKSGIKNGEYNAVVEAKIETEDNKGYYVYPWKDTIKVLIEPKISIVENNCKNENFSIKTDLVIEKDENTILDIKPNKHQKVKSIKSNLSKIFESE